MSLLPKCKLVESLDFSTREELSELLDGRGGSWTKIASEFNFTVREVAHIDSLRESQTQVLLNKLSHIGITVCELRAACKKQKLIQCYERLNSKGSFTDCQANHDCDLPLPPSVNYSEVSTLPVRSADWHVTSNTDSVQANHQLYHSKKPCPNVESNSVKPNYIVCDRCSPNEVEFLTIQNITYGFDIDNILPSRNGHHQIIYKGVLDEEDVVVKNFSKPELNSDVSQSEIRSALDVVISQSQEIDSLVSVLKYCFDAGAKYIISKLEDAPTLEHLIKNVSGALTSKDKLQILRNVAACISEMHAAGFIHGNLKSSNIYVKVDLQVVVGDPDFMKRCCYNSQSSLTKNDDMSSFSKLLLDIFFKSEVEEIDFKTNAKFSATAKKCLRTFQDIDIVLCELKDILFLYTQELSADHNSTESSLTNEKKFPSFLCLDAKKSCEIFDDGLQTGESREYEIDTGSQTNTGNPLPPLKDTYNLIHGNTREREMLPVTATQNCLTLLHISDDRKTEGIKQTPEKHNYSGAPFENPRRETNGHTDQINEQHYNFPNEVDDREFSHPGIETTEFEEISDYEEEEDIEEEDPAINKKFPSFILD